MMTKKNVWLIFVMVGYTLISSAIACGFPAVAIVFLDGVLPGT
jgi:hypothetical protein